MPWLRSGPKTTGALASTLRAPSLHFLAIGLGLFALLPAPRPVVVLDAAEVEELRRGWAEVEGRLPTQHETEELIASAVDDAILLQEAWSRGVSDGDPVVAERLDRIGLFLSQHQDEEELGGEAPGDHARALGLDRQDVVIRRYLVTMMRLAIAREADRDLPSDDDLAAHLREHARRFMRPETVRFSHVFVSARAGGDVEARARALLGELADVLPGEAVDHGDPFPTGREVTASKAKISQTFGPEFGSAIDDVVSGRWQGPVPSGYGQHLVWVHDRTPSELPTLDEVRSQVAHHYLRTRRAEHVRKRLDALRQRYEVEIDSSRS